MTGSETLILRAALAVAAGAGGIALTSSSRLQSIPLRKFKRWVAAAFFGTRIGLFVGLFLIARLAPRGDIPSYYMAQAEQVLRGRTPYRDFASSYAPLHPYLDAALIHTWHTPLAMILFSVVAECLMVPLWLYLGPILFPEREFRKAALLYLSSVVSFLFVTIDGHDDVLLATFMALSIFWLYHNRHYASGFAIGLGSVLTKFLPLVYAPIFFFTSIRRWRWTAGLMSPVAIVYGGFALRHIHVLSVLSKEGNLRSANNLTFLIEGLLGITLPSTAWNALLGAAIALIIAIVGKAVVKAPTETRLRSLAFGTAALTLAIELFAKKSWPPYLVMALFPICLIVTAGSVLDIVLFVSFGLVAVVAPSYWSTNLRQLSAGDLHRGLVAGQLHCYICLILQVALIAGYAWLLFSSLKRITASQKMPRPQATALRD